MKLVLAACFLAALSLQPVFASQRYFVNSSLGADTNPGTVDAPWKSLSAVSAHTFAAGDIIAFARGMTYSGALELDSSGTAEQPIRLVAYGSGDLPLFTNPGGLYCIRISGSSIILDHLGFTRAATMTAWTATTYQQSGAVLVAEGADDVAIENCDFTQVGVGVKTYGLRTLVRGNAFHDLVIAYSDDKLSYGAIGVSIDNSYADVDHNTFTRCRSTDSPYGADGGAVEIEGYTNQAKDHISISHNRSSMSQGFLEVTETTSNYVHVFENVSDDYQQFIAFDTTVVPSHYEVDHNTVIRSRTPNVTAVFAIFFYREVDARPNDGWLTIADNIFYTPVCKVLRGSYTYIPYDFPHSGNVFYDGGPDPVGYPLGPGDIIADPKFVDFRSRDFHLQPDSPAQGKGAELP